MGEFRRQILFNRSQKAARKWPTAAKWRLWHIILRCRAKVQGMLMLACVCIFIYFLPFLAMYRQILQSCGNGESDQPMSDHEWLRRAVLGFASGKSTTASTVELYGVGLTIEKVRVT